MFQRLDNALNKSREIYVAKYFKTVLCRKIPDEHFSSVAESDPHQSVKSNPEPYQSEKRSRIRVKGQNRILIYVMRIRNHATEAHLGAVEAHYGAVAIHKIALEGLSSVPDSDRDNFNEDSYPQEDSGSGSA